MIFNENAGGWAKSEAGWAYLLRLVGERRAKFLLLTGEMLTAAQAVEYGLAHEVAPDADLLARARHFATQFATFPPEAVARTKAVLARLRELHGTERIEEARRLSVSVTFTDAARDSILRFLET